MPSTAVRPPGGLQPVRDFRGKVAKSGIAGTQWQESGAAEQDSTRDIEPI
jgi:hypothetical protein